MCMSKYRVIIYNVCILFLYLVIHTGFLCKIETTHFYIHYSVFLWRKTETAKKKLRSILWYYDEKQRMLLVSFQLNEKCELITKSTHRFDRRLMNGNSKFSLELNRWTEKKVRSTITK